MDGGKVFDGATSSNGNDDRVTASFEKPVKARYVRMTVVAYTEHPSMRAGLIVGDRPVKVDPELDGLEEASRFPSHDVPCYSLHSPTLTLTALAQHSSVADSHTSR